MGIYDNLSTDEKQKFRKTAYYDAWLHSGSIFCFIELLGTDEERQKQAEVNQLTIDDYYLAYKQNCLYTQTSLGSTKTKNQQTALCAATQTFCKANYQTVGSNNALKVNSYKTNQNVSITATLWNNIRTRLEEITKFGKRGTRVGNILQADTYSGNTKVTKPTKPDPKDYGLKEDGNIDYNNTSSGLKPYERKEEYQKAMEEYAKAYKKWNNATLKNIINLWNKKTSATDIIPRSEYNQLLKKLNKTQLDVNTIITADRWNNLMDYLNAYKLNSDRCDICNSGCQSGQGGSGGGGGPCENGTCQISQQGSPGSGVGGCVAAKTATGGGDSGTIG